MRAPPSRLSWSRAVRPLLLLALLAPLAAEARPVSPRAGGFELGGAGFLVAEDAGGPPARGGPMLHLAVRLPASESVLVGLMGRLGVSLDSSGGPTSLLALDVRYLLGDLDLAPYGALGAGVLFRALPETGNLSEITQRPDIAFPVALGLETRLGDALMLGFALRYTVVATDLERAIGPIDTAIYLVFL